LIDSAMEYLSRTFLIMDEAFFCKD